MGDTLEHSSVPWLCQSLVHHIHPLSPAPAPFVSFHNSRRGRDLDQAQKGNIGRDAIYSGALSNDLLFIQNWVNSNTSAETSKHGCVQWFHKQLFNSPLPAFPDKWSPSLLFCGEGSHCFVYSLGQSGVGVGVGDTKIPCPSLKLSR